MKNRAVTIYTIPGPNHVEALMKQGIAGGWDYAFKCIELISKLNPDNEFEVVFGHASEFGDVPTFPKLSNVRYHVYIVSKFELALKFPDQPSSQHGALLNYALHQHPLNTDFYAILDPDCYLFQQHSFNRMIEHMRAKEIAILGVGYPTTLPKACYWDFPTAYFQLMDSSKCAPREMNFLPDENSFVLDSRQPGGAGVPSPGAVKAVFRLPRFLKIAVLKIMRQLSLRNDAVSIFLRHLPLNRPYENQELFHDTGWFNRVKFKHLEVEVIPHLVPEVSLHSILDTNEYLSNNEDVRCSGIDPTWHFLTNGVFENREFGAQKSWARVLIALFNKGLLRQSEHPATSLAMGKSIFQIVSKPVNWGNMRNGFEYQWEGEPFCLHLGHAGKSTKSEDMFKLDVLENNLLPESGFIND